MDFSCEPNHSSNLQIRSKEPFNAEPPVDSLVAHEYTPENLVYCRNHGPVPTLDDTYTLKVDGKVKKELSFPVAALESQFQSHDVVAALQCAGNRRNTMALKKEVSGVGWGDGVVCNAKWSGVYLRDVLLKAGVDPSAKAGFVCFESDFTSTQDDSFYGGSISLVRAMDKDADVLLATHMNGVRLSYDRGFPLRVIVPGYCGARWVKWLHRITVSDQESPNYYQKKDYKVLPPDVDSRERASKAWDSVPPVELMPVNSAVASAEIRPTGNIYAKGYALGDVVGVKVSVNKGRSWAWAKITYQEGKWSWKLWEIEMPIDERDQTNGKVEVWSAAVSRDNETQPLDCTWNYRGVCYNGPGVKVVG
ncbi:hypothetical protein SISNIDRAFT_454013 [Sistotremastrum niveocremeum HHB9708]|uniref:Molybdopterin binding oxidoreductase n=1 Tax=Sistotremastrum niveocremeum HHB9708 TaxID=1314777 RepID=A0A164VM05_9AGAM|nr:hypothetical protein SISNIDRAFT_454013 [Sistotremastrum niveocremeum HHB9708]